MKAERAALLGGVWAAERAVPGGARCIYIRMADHARFREQVESALAQLVDDPGRALSEKSALVYETSLELMNELLTAPDLSAHARRLENVARSVATVVLSDPRAFGHLFATSHHDFYTATHCVNVGTWMVPLAWALGCRDRQELADVCQAGLLHDYGKVSVPADLLNKPGCLSEEEWRQIKRHPLLGWERLAAQESIPDLARKVCRQHHEREDGSGYPDGLTGAKIDPVSKMCAVVDSFDAMTAVRPFRQVGMTVSEAIMALRADTPRRSDGQVVDAWVTLLREVNDSDVRLDAGHPAPQRFARAAERRRNKRFACNRPARLRPLLHADGGGWREGPPLPVVVHNTSRFGLGLLSPLPVDVGQFVRVQFEGPHWASRRLRGQAVRCRAYADGWFEIGLELFPPGSRPEAP